ncbi:hypothetical protein HK102_002842 [Quaeritorhiza haematococci]|nr:hypothetical protein HK102_002842 [Quaeritorhiza haematococci]
MPGATEERTQVAVADDNNEEMVVAEQDEDEQILSPTSYGIASPTTACPPNRPTQIHHIVETVDRWAFRLYGTFVELSSHVLKPRELLPSLGSFLDRPTNEILAFPNRYNPQNIPLLENYILEQMEKNTYDRASCLAVLKLYQFNPHLTNVPMITNILALALGALPDPDFNLALCLLNENIISDPTVAKLIFLQQNLEQARFKDFWALLDSENEDESARELVAGYPMFDTQIREFISTTISIAYQTIAVEKLEQYLSLVGEDLRDWVEAHGWTFDPETEGLVHLPVTKENQVKTVTVRENIKFEQLTKIIGHGRLIQ